MSKNRLKLSEYLDKEKKSRKVSINKSTLYDFEWQLLRVNLDFSSSVTTRESIEKILFYTDSKDINKIWRALNLMAATRMGFSGLFKLIKCKEKLKDLKIRDNLVCKIRNQLSEQYKELQKLNYKITVKPKEHQFLDLKNASNDNFSIVFNSLVFRYENSSHSASRPELKEYLQLMQEVLFCKPLEDQNKILKSLEIKLKGLRKSRKQKILDWSNFI